MLPLIVTNTTSVRYNRSPLQAGEELAPEASYDSASLWTEAGRLAPQGASAVHTSRSGHSAVPQFQSSPPATLEEAMQRQRRLLHGAERRRFGRVPKVRGRQLATWHRVARLLAGSQHLQAWGRKVTVQCPLPKPKSTSALSGWHCSATHDCEGGAAVFAGLLRFMQGMTCSQGKSQQACCFVSAGHDTHPCAGRCWCC